MCALLASSPPPRHARTRRDAAGRARPSHAVPAWRAQQRWPHVARTPHGDSSRRVRAGRPVPLVCVSAGRTRSQRRCGRSERRRRGSTAAAAAAQVITSEIELAQRDLEVVVRPPARARVCALSSLVPDSASKSTDSVNTGTHARTDECEVREPGRERPPSGPRPPACRGNCAHDGLQRESPYAPIPSCGSTHCAFAPTHGALRAPINSTHRSQ
jgi:hypothetical protein